ncbi:ATP-binding cassette domain-containing protein [Candidatus Entotheonella palauensis]|nr:ATP-binding cassette domain-containing protein [Candidatus Entotheonella palauensis]
MNPNNREQPTVCLRQLHHDFGSGEFSKRVLYDINFDLMPGEITVMTGPSGSGKTTLLTLIGALRSVQKGSVRILGQELKGLSHRQRIEVRRNIGFIFQLHNLFDALSGFQNVMMGLELHANKRKEKHQLVTQMLTELGLSHRMHAKPQAMSGGERQRVAIARALVSCPRLVLADEPTAALDQDRGRQVVKLLQRLAQEHRASVIMVTHDQRIIDVADRIVNLVDGHPVSNIVVQESLMICEFLMQCPVFTSLSPGMLTAMADRMTREQYPDGSIIFHQGDAGDKFYIIRQGAVNILVDDGISTRVLATRTEGSLFGEAALLTGNPRNATVQAIGEVTLYSLGHDDFQTTLDANETLKAQVIRMFFQRQ